MAQGRRFRVAGAQVYVTRDIAANAATIVKAIQWAGDQQADFLVFPEMTLTGYWGGFEQKARDAALKDVLAAVKKARVAILLGTGHKQGGDGYIQVRAYTEKARLIGTHEKTIPTDGDMSWCTRGWGPRVFKHKKLMFGCLICNDFWVTPGCGTLPDMNLPGWLAFLGAEVIFHSIYSGKSGKHFWFHSGMLERRARENGLFVVTANAAQQKGVNAPSGVIGPDGKWLVKAKLRGEQMYVQDIELPAETDRPWR